ncbi:zinc ABC transporter substrate-binding protein [Pelagibius sp. Alg239-R121]|uniref:metal ABC transporter solute-binding protein, Zn/Mn family n=1 Tax=Pelagibius sp. Alg239-R121 TaxID=2993448 RepID=UPI0024A6E118|nr:zinc ABC transporter substrate-binding protein [Pelagibius sp. Alg239-R121]
MKRLRRRMVSLFALAGAAASAGATLYAPDAQALDDGTVVTSIKPVHSLVSGVMEGVGKPHLIVRGSASPHTYSLRPSDAGKLQEAKVIFWIGEGLETFLTKPLESLGENAKLVTLSDAHDLVKLPFREGGPFEKHDHDEEGHEDGHHDEHGHKDEHAHEDEHGHKDEHGHHEEAEHHKESEAHEDHDHDKHDESDHAKHGHDEHDHDEHGHEDEHGHGEEAHADEHAHGEFDMHLWLDPQNAKAMLHEIEEALVAVDPANAATYESNAKRLSQQLDGLIEEVKAELAPLHNRPFIVFHDAYQYFERRFDVTAAGSITVDPDVIPGVQRVAEIQSRVKELGGTCVFAEPQFEPKLVQVVTEGTTARSGVLDPLGTGLDEGPGHYFQLIRTMSSSIKDCLSGNS